VHLKLERRANEAGRRGPSIRVNDQWRVVFKWKDAAAHEVKIDDYR
jgi:plasmid maintenance system killer protein